MTRRRGCAEVVAVGYTEAMGVPTAAVQRMLPAHPSSVPEARALLRQALTDAAWLHVLDDVALSVSELVTNALVHAGTPMTLTAWVREQTVRVEISDGSPHLPAPRDYTAMAGTGRGLRMLEQLVDRWGADPRGDGKTVWFELDAASRFEEGHRADHVLTDQAGAADAGPDGGSVVVTLLNVPLLLHQAWHPHAEALLREYLLARLDEDTGLAELQTHALANEALTLLREQVPAPAVGDDPEAVMADAVEPLVSAARVSLAVPVGSVPHFAFLDRTLEDAVNMADSGVLLNPPTQPELRALRHWLCHEVITQGNGGDPTAWAPDAGEREFMIPVRRASQDVEAGVAGETVRALVAADDTNRIIAVSRPGLRILGYDGPEDIVGRRIVDIIPERYRQAHLAGFTLHLAVGRSPLLDAAVTVPALRRDGSEVTVELTVTARNLPRGHRLFLAEFKEPS